MSKIIFFMCVVGLLVPATLMAKVEKVTLKGAIKGLGNEELILMNSDRSEITRTKTKNDHFEIVTEVETGDLRYYILYAPSVGPLGPSMAIPTIHFFIDSPKITVEAELKDKQMCLKSLKGSPGWEEHNRILESLPSSLTIQKVYDRYNQAFHEYNEVEQTEENMKELKAASHEIDVLQRQRREEIFGLFPQYTTSMPFAVIISSYFGIDNIDEAEKVWNQFDPSIRHCYALKQLENLIQRGKNCAVGHEAPNFELITSTGGKIALSSLRGKYVLIDFWASWCGPCRQEMKNLRILHKEFAAKGVRFVSISFDDSVEKWKEACEEEQIPWMSLHDKNGWKNSKIRKAMGIQFIPFIVLLDRDGNIIAKNIRRNQLRDKLLEVTEE